MATALCEAYISYAAAKAAIEAIDDTKIISVFPFNANGQKAVIVVVKKA